MRVGNTEDSAVLRGYYTTTSATWQQAHLHIGSFPGSFVVQFAGSRYVLNETVAIDNVQFHDCALPEPLAKSVSTCPVKGQILCPSTRVCIDPGDLCDFEDNCGDNWDERFELCAKRRGVPPNCAMEKSLEDCGFSQKSDEKYFDWQLERGYDSNMIYYSEPAADHTT